MRIKKAVVTNSEFFNFIQFFIKYKSQVYFQLWFGYYWAFKIIWNISFLSFTRTIISSGDVKNLLNPSNS